MITQNRVAIRNNAYDVLLRGVSFSYIGLLIILPVIAITVRSLQGGISTLWEDITLPQALFSLKLTISTALIMLLINVVTGTATAWVLVRYHFPGKQIMNALIDLPFAMPTNVAGIMLVAIYGPKSVIGSILLKYDTEIMFNKPGIILALLFVTFPFVVRAVQPVLLEIDQDMEEAAKTLGASSITIFFRIVLPSLLPSILTGAALSFSRALGEFGSIIMVAGNIPFKTQVASVFIYGEIESYNPQGALGVSVVLLLFSFVMLLLLNLIQYWNRRHEEK
ncbi:MAG: sulfate ABC transporter permease subunit CysT [Proteobacteria bacterium]|nr:sulfate ABC transporter permease subunit CysT [Pseudomonadota bacterium]